MKATAIFLASLLVTGGATTAGGPAGPANDPDTARPAPPGILQTSGEGQAPDDASGPSAEASGVERANFIRKIVITVEGDEIGIISDVGYSAAYGEPVAVVDVDAYIGIGEKRIAIPLSRFESSAAHSDSVTTTLNRQGIETAKEFSEEDFTPAGVKRRGALECGHCERAMVPRSSDRRQPEYAIYELKPNNARSIREGTQQLCVG